MTKKANSILYGGRDIAYRIIHTNRRTLEIAVLPDASVVIKAPLETRHEEIEKRVAKRARWICRQIAYFRQFNPRTPPRQYLSGETHLYLGRRYRLKLKSGKEDSIKLTRGLFLVTSQKRNSPGHIKSLLDNWYADRARHKLHESFERCWESIHQHTHSRPSLSIRRMKTRWGSLSKNGILTLNVELIRAPQDCIDYVITHELCHLNHHDHGPGFYKLLEKVMPDWERRKHRLELSLI
jgi:hypothetical protein